MNGKILCTKNFRSIYQLQSSNFSLSSTIGSKLYFEHTNFQICILAEIQNLAESVVSALIRDYGAESAL